MQISNTSLMSTNIHVAESILIPTSSNNLPTHMITKDCKEKTVADFKNVKAE